ncbi:hypothetical protein BLNAU_20116 [Blattamonas nauphoetae]|uniref:Uncharacterized protein n=1 Tax=Blattamonas nauphoetae TaxID=2049346 RepID=A0ABQ9WZP1_9EUKA|nr:hypothetical protein BLNAU_20116 [Blattamonas nauphoetae]
MEMLRTLLLICSLVASDLMPRLVIILDRLSLSFDEAEDIHPSLIPTIVDSLRFAAPPGLTCGTIEGENERQAVRETMFKQVLIPSEKYLCHLSVNNNPVLLPIETVDGTVPASHHPSSTDLG